MTTQPLTPGLRLPSGARLVSFPGHLSGHVLVIPTGPLAVKCDGPLLVLGANPGAGARQAPMAFRVAGRLRGIRDATSMPVWTLPCKAGQPVSLPPGSWALAKPGEVSPCAVPPPAPPGPLIVGAPVVGAYHIALMGSWRRIVDEQSDRLVRSGLLTRTERVLIGVVGGELKASNLRPELAAKATIQCHPDVRKFEFPTLKMLRDHAEGREFKAWYVHTKGASGHGDPTAVRAWRDMMETFVVDRWRDCVAALDEFDCCGVNLRDRGRTYEKVGETRKLGERFSGNFWWATSRHLASLPRVEELDWTDRLQAEMAFVRRRGTAKSFLDVPGDPYQKETWEKVARRGREEKPSIGIEDVLRGKGVGFRGHRLMSGVELSILDALIKENGIETVLEIGINEGMTAAELLKANPSITRYVGVDLSDDAVAGMPRRRHQREGKVVGKAALGDPRFSRWMAPGGSRDYPRDGRFDMVIIDGDHSYEMAKHDTELAAALGAKVVAWHDYGALEGVTKAVDEAAGVVRVRGTRLAYRATGHVKSPHGSALREIKSLIWGTSIREVATKKPWGFYASIPLENVTLVEYLSKPHSYVDTTILHILAGEGAEIGQVQSAIQKASKESFRVLVLEHNPASPDWVGNPLVSESRVSAIKQAMSGFVTMESRVGDGRNLILKHDSIPLLDLGKATRSDVTGGFYSMTSEDYRSATLFSAPVAEALNRVDGSRTYHTVVGGMMFLDGLVQMNPRPIHLFDISIPQLAYLLATLDLIAQARSREHFETLRAKPSFTKGTRERLATMYDIGKIVEALASTPASRPGDGFQNRWKNVLRKGAWLDHFHETKNKLSMIKRISHVNIRYLSPEAGDIVYASTIEGRLDNLSGCHVVRCLNPRDMPRVEPSRTC